MVYVWRTAKIVTGSLFAVYAVLPICIYLFPVMHQHFLFMNMVKWPYTNYSDPRKLGVLYPCRNFHLQVDSDIKIGVWHILPKSLRLSSRNDASTKEEEETLFEKSLSESGKPIVVYLHGNTWTRSAPHRIKLYNILASADYHVLALDYRGYGDSSGSPSEKGVVFDAMYLYKWTRERAGNNPVFIWSHSLGTAIGTAAVKKLCHEHLCPAGFVLEAPFNNLGSIVRHHALTKPFRWMPWFDKILVEPFEHLGLYFTTDERIKDVDCPMLIMHAKDDRVIPFKLGEQLKDIAIDNGKDVMFKEFDSELNYGHKYICNAPELVDIVNEFFGKCIDRLKPPSNPPSATEEDDNNITTATAS